MPNSVFHQTKFVQRVSPPPPPQKKKFMYKEQWVEKISANSKIPQASNHFSNGPSLKCQYFKTYKRFGQCPSSVQWRTLPETFVRFKILTFYKFSHLKFKIDPVRLLNIYLKLLYTLLKNFVQISTLFRFEVGSIFHTQLMNASLDLKLPGS